MTELLNGLFQTLTPLWAMSLTAAYVTAVVAILRLVLKKHAPKQVICLLWLVVFVRLLVPVSLESPLSIIPDDPVMQLEENLHDQPEDEDSAEPIQSPVQELDPVQDPNPSQINGMMAVTPASQGNTNRSPTPALTVPSGMAPTAPQTQSPVSFPWQALLAGLWSLGVLSMGSYGLFSYLRLRRRLFDAIRTEDGAWEHPCVGSPFILGMVRPRIYLPAGLQGQPRQFILCHERAHLKRLDHIVKPICWAALALHWFNPAIWAAFILMSRDIESACDESVIRQLGPAVKADYSATLLSLATNGRVPAPCPLAFDEGDAKGRIQNVLRYRRPALWMIVVSVILSLTAAVCLLTDPVSALGSDDPVPDPAAPVPEASASQPPEDIPNSVPEPLPTMPDWAEEVLSGQRQFYSVSQQKQLDLEPLNAAYGEPDAFYDLDHKLAVVDLDGDGEDEIILEPCYTGTPANESDQNLQSLGYLILHAEGDQVYGYTPGYSSFTEVKVGGIYQFFTFASGPDYNAYDSGWGHVRFTDEGMEPDPIILAHSRTDAYPNETDHYIEGEPATQEEYDQAFRLYNMMPAVSWYRWYEDTGLLSSVVRSDQSTFTPKFLGDGMRELYRQASYFYYHLFGESTAGICGLDSVSAWFSGLYDPTNTVERDGLTYVRATGRFTRWADLMTAVDALFTRDFWDACNQWDGHELFINVDGDTYFLPAFRLYRDYCDGGPVPFTLVEQTEDSVTVMLTAAYNRYQEGEDGVAWGQRLDRGYDYTVDYTIRYVKTEDGWRFDEFHYPQSDPREYTMGHILWQTDPLHAVNGWMDDVTLRQIGPDTLLDWLGNTYKLEPDVNVNTFTGRMYVLDVDGDGQTEASLVYRGETGSAIIAVYERENSGLRRVTFDTAKLAEDFFDPFATVERNPEGGLTITHTGPWEVTTIQLSDAVFDGYEWLREGEIYAKMESDIFYAGLFSEVPLTPPFAINSYAYLTDGVNNGHFVAHMFFVVDYDGSRLTPGQLYLEPYSEFAVQNG